MTSKVEYIIIQINFINISMKLQLVFLLTVYLVTMETNKMVMVQAGWQRKPKKKGQVNMGIPDLNAKEIGSEINP